MKANKDHGPASGPAYSRTSDRGNARSRGRAQPGAPGTGASALEDEFESRAGQAQAERPRPAGLSLKARAVGYLSRREHSRMELARKLAPHGEEDDIRQVLDVLEKEGWLSTERYAHSVAHRLAPKQGAARIVRELRQHGVADAQIDGLRRELQATELARAQEVWRKRYGQLPIDAAQRAKQIRFLMARGFGQDTIRQVLRGLDLDDLEG